MSITFRYVHVPRPDGTLRKAPFIPIEVRNRNDKLLKVVALLDSGADYTVVPLDLAKVLGLKLKKETSTTAGIGGSVPVRGSTMKFSVRGERERFSLTVPVLVLQNEYEDVPLLLGRNGFFEHFHIMFKQNVEKIVLKKINPRP